MRKELRRWLRKLHDEFQITSVFVTHDQEEALDVADRIVVMNEVALNKWEHRKKYMKTQQVRLYMTFRKCKFISR